MFTCALVGSHKPDALASAAKLAATGEGLMSDIDSATADPVPVDGGTDKLLISENYPEKRMMPANTTLWKQKNQQSKSPLP